jgi:hypothetical protein
MAKSYLGYVEKDQQAFVDWGAIGSQISQDLDKIRVNRQEQRDELDRVTNEAVTTINELTANQPKLVSEFYMDGANDMRQYLLMLNKEMKAGRLNPAEYMKKKQVLMDGVTQLGDASKAFAEDYENAMKRLQNGEAAAQEVFQNEMYDAFRTTEDKGIYVNPADGRVYIAKRNADGTINRNQADLLSVNKLYARRKDQINKFDVIGETSKKVNVLGDVVKAMRRGNVMTLKDVMQNPQYKKAEGDIINSMMASPRNAASILTDYIGGYQFTQDPAVAASTPNTILLKEDGMGLLMPELTAEQRKTAEEALRAQIRVQLDKVETPMPVFAPQRDSGFGGFGAERQKNLGHLELVRKIYAGSPEEVNSALQNIPSINPEIKRVTKSGGNITIEYNPDKDGNVKPRRVIPIPQSGGPGVAGFELFATNSGRALIPNLDVETAFIDWQQSPYKGRAEGYRKAGGVSSSVPQISSSIISMTEEEAVPKMAQILGDGYTVEQSGWGDNMTITANNGQSIQISLDEDKQENIDAEMAKLMRFLERNPAVSSQTSGGTSR